MSNVTIYCIGADPAARVDYTGLGVLSADGSPWDDTTKWKAEALSRLPGGTYGAVAAMIKTVVIQTAARAEQTGASVLLAIDATGPGEPVAELIWDWLGGRRGKNANGELPVDVHMKGFTLLSIEKDQKSKRVPWKVSVDRHGAISDLLVGLEQGRVDLRHLDEDAKRIARDEMEALRSRLMDSGKERIEHRPNKHDDAMWGLACALRIGRMIPAPTKGVISVATRKDGIRAEGVTASARIMRR